MIAIAILAACQAQTFVTPRINTPIVVTPPTGAVPLSLTTPRLQLQVAPLHRFQTPDLAPALSRRFSSPTETHGLSTGPQHRYQME